MRFYHPRLIIATITAHGSNSSRVDNMPRGDFGIAFCVMFYLLIWTCLVFNIENTIQSNKEVQLRALPSTCGRRSYMRTSVVWWSRGRLYYKSFNVLQKCAESIDDHCYFFVVLFGSMTVMLLLPQDLTSPLMYYCYIYIYI